MRHALVKRAEVASDISYMTVGGMVTDDDGFLTKLVLNWATARRPRSSLGIGASAGPA